MGQDDPRKTTGTGSGVFLGEHEHSVDGKGRIVMPRAYREELEGEIVITKGRDANLIVFRSEDFEEEARRVQAEAGTGKKGRAYARTFSASADMQSVDTKTGRVLLKESLREFAGLEPGGQVIVVGNFDTVELWNPDRYEEARALGEERYLADEEDDPAFD
ncbi:MAG: hypothetical protein R3324_19055 [Halobacteriales archaeon]|nr:hypothetical protein [Halobacteriales archaeon]